MNAWILSAALCVSASAQVVETARVAAPSVPGAAGAAAGAAAGIPTLPPAAVLAPSLGLGAMLGAPQPRVNFAPPAASAPAAARPAAVEASPRAEQPTGRAPARKDSAPPSMSEAGRTVPVAASWRGRQSVGGMPESAPAQPETGGRLSANASAVPVEGAAAAGRREWDRSSEHASLEGGSPVAAQYARAAFAASPEARAGRSGALRDQAFEAEALRDAVASPASLPSVSFIPRPGASAMAPQRQAPRAVVGGSVPLPGEASPPATSLDRLSLELASGLVVKVRAALGFSPASASARAGLSQASAAPRIAPVTGAPLTSTEWLERRGLFETLSAVESVAGDVSAAALPAKPGRGAFAAISELSRSVRTVPAPAAPALPTPIFWGLAFLPAAAALLREFL